jgi:hypothetical protein
MYTGDAKLGVAEYTYTADAYTADAGFARGPALLVKLQPLEMAFSVKHLNA